MDYFTRYGMEFNPFIKNSREILVNSAEYDEAVFRLGYLAKTKGFGVITGSSGRGKTTVVRSWASSLNPSLYKVVYSCLSTLTAMDFYRNMAFGLGMEPCCRKTDNFRLIQGEISRLSLEKRKTPVIIIDEANYINTAILNDLKLLFNFEMDSRDRAVILLVGLPKLNATLNLAMHEPLKQRIVMNYNLEGLTKDEARDYIHCKLKGAGCSQAVFDEAAIEAVINAADGTPRLINKYCNAGLLVADSSKLDIVTKEAIMQAVNDSELG